VIGHPTLTDLRLLLEILEAYADGELADLVYADIVESALRADEAVRTWALTEASRIHNPITRFNLAKNAEPTGSSSNHDVLILSIKPIELKATLLALGFGSGAVNCPSEELRGYPVWETSATDASGHPVNIAISAVGEGGSDASISALHSLLEVLKTRAVMICGMAAGIRGKVELGDVIAVTRALEYTYGTLKEGGFSSEPKPFTVRGAIARRLEFFHPGSPTQWSGRIQSALDTWEGEAQSLLPPGIATAHQPTFKVGGVLAGDWKYEAGELATFAAGRMQGVLGLDMESDGFIRVADESSVAMYIFRGIADHGGEVPDGSEMGDLVRSREWQFLATLAAATAARRFIETRPITRLLPES
jgi:nucleoside phosphorylase